MPCDVSTENFSEFVYDVISPYDGIPLKLMIAGGSVLNCLSELSTLDSSKWEIFFSDERNDRSNYKNAQDFIKTLKSGALVHPIKDSDEYNALLENVTIDVALLGIGENGHICSIWPKNNSISSNLLCESVTVDDKIPHRMTVTEKFLNSQISDIFFLLPPKDGQRKKIRKPDQSINVENYTVVHWAQ